VKCPNCHDELPPGAEACPACGRQDPDRARSFAALNEAFAGRYDFLRLLGVGGFAEVYMARDTVLERDVAVKILLPQHARDPQTVERFLREAKLYAKLDHPNIIPVYDTGVQGGHVFITMKYIHGESLKRAPAPGGRLDSARLAAVAAGVARALAYIHRHGIVHRDIKPANILVEPGCQAVFLADFGIARAESSQTLTQTGMIVGTPHYLSPEQIKGHKLDPRSDIYALGATLYELAAGRPPFHGDSPLEILYQHINECPEPLERLAPGLDPALARLIHRCIEKDPARRFQSADDLVERIEGLITAPLERTVLTAATQARRRRRAPFAWAAAGMALAVSLAVYFFWLRPSRPAAPLDVIPPPAREAEHQAALVRKQPSSLPAPDKRNGVGAQDAPPASTGNEPASRSAAPGPSRSVPPTTAKRDAAFAPPEAPPQTGVIRFSSFPPVAYVFSGGERIGSTEQVFEKPFPPGEHVFTFTIPDFQSAEVRVTVAAGATASAHHRFPPFRSFTVTARPFGRVEIDGRDYGDTPQTVKIAFGEHLVRVTKPGYRDGEQRIIIGPNAKNSIFFELTKEGP
jgi:serine/threonine protein kinase